MRVFKVLMISVFLFFSAGLAAGDVPDLYYLEDASDGNIPVHACFRSSDSGDDSGDERDADQSSVSFLTVNGFDCSVVAEITQSQLIAFLLSQQNLSEGERLARAKAYRQNRDTLYGLSVITSVFGAVTFAMAIKKVPRTWVSGAILFLTAGGLGLFGYDMDKKANNSFIVNDDFLLRQQVRTRVIGGTSEAHKIILKKFTDFINQAGTRFDSTSQGSSPH